MIAKNDIISLKLTDQNNLGNGVGRAEDGRVVFVQGGVAGDTVKARVIKLNSGFYVARLERMISPSENRCAESFCDAPESCGGCVYRHIRYEHELELKREYVKNAFKKAGLPETEIGEVLTTGQISGYRNKAQYPVQNGKNGLSTGFYASRTHRIVGGHCPLQPEVFDRIASLVCRYCDERGVKAYDEKSGTGCLRHIYIRQAFATGEIMVCPVLRCSSAVFDAEFVKALIGEFPQIVCIMLNYNRRETNVVTGDEYSLLYGREYIEDELLGFRFRITPDAFWQVNHDGAELLYRCAAKQAELKGDETVLDLYCGTGSIGLTMSGSIKRLIGIEIVPRAVECAKLNARLNGVDNAEFYCGDASCAEGLIASAEKKSKNGAIDADVVILDPPRKGSTNELLGYIAKRKIGKVVYVSCSPDTLARDAAELVRLGYNIKGKVTPVDMFPRTGHVESVALFER